MTSIGGNVARTLPLTRLDPPPDAPSDNPRTLPVAPAPADCFCAGVERHLSEPPANSGDIAWPEPTPEVGVEPNPSPSPDPSTLRNVDSAPGLNAGQLGNLNRVIDAVRDSGLEGEDAERALVALTAAALPDNGFSALTGARHQLRNGTTGLFNLPETSSLGRLTVGQRNDVSTALGLLLDKNEEGSLAGMAEQGRGFGDIASALGTGGSQRSRYAESVEFLAESGAISPEAAERLRATVAADETLTDRNFGVASMSTTHSFDDLLAYRPTPGQSFDAGRSGGRIHNGVDFDSRVGLGSNAPVQSAFGEGTVVTTSAWGGGTWDPGSGSPSNAIRIRHDLPGRDGLTFDVDYGHVQINSTLQVQNGDRIEAGQQLGRLAFDDNWSQGGHLDVKIRIPASIAGEFPPGTTRATGDGQAFVDPQTFMRWYREQAAQG